MNIVPMSMGMMFLGQFDESEDEQSEPGPEGAEQVPASEHPAGEDSNIGSRLRRRGRIQEVLEEETESDDSDHDNEEAPGMPEILRQMAAMQRRFLEITRRERHLVQRHTTEEEEEDQGLGDELEEREAVGAVAAVGGCRRRMREEEEPTDDILLNKSPEDTSNTQKSNWSLSASSDEMEVELLHNNVSSAIPITAGQNRQRCSSSTSVSTSYTSGIGTCSSLEEPTEMDFIKELEDEDTMGMVKAGSTPTNGATNYNPSHKITSNGASTTNGHMTNSPSTAPDSRKKKKTSAAASMPIPVYEDEDEESTQCYSNCLPSGRDKSSNHTMECDAEDTEVQGQDGHLSYRHVMTNYIDQLPIPLALKQFVSFYRI